MTTKLEVKSTFQFALPLNTHPNRAKVLLAMLAVYIIWGSTYLAMRYAVETFPPFLMSSIRYFFAGGLMFIYLWLRGTPLPTPRQWLNTLLVGSLLLGVGTGGVAYAEQWVDSGLAALAVAAVPLWAALFSGLWGRWPNRLEWLGLAFGLSGVAFLNLENGMQASPQGAFALIIGPLCWAFGSVWSRKLSMPQGLMSAAGQMLGGSLCLLLISALVFRENMTAMPSTSSLLAVLYLIIFGALVGFTAYMYLLSQVRASVATSYAYVNPVIAVLLGALFVGERISPLGIAAMSIILAGVALVLFAREAGLKENER